MTSTSPLLMGATSAENFTVCDAGGGVISTVVQQSFFVLFGALALTSNTIAVAAIFRKGTLRRRPEMQIIASLSLACMVNGLGFFTMGIRCLIVQGTKLTLINSVDCLITSFDVTPSLLGRQCEPLLNLLVSVDRLIAVEYSKLYSSISHKRAYLFFCVYFPWLLTVSSISGGWCTTLLSASDSFLVCPLCDRFIDFLPYTYVKYHNGVEATFTFVAIVIYLVVVFFYERQRRRSQRIVPASCPTEKAAVAVAAPPKRKSIIRMASNLASRLQAAAAVDDPTKQSNSDETIPHVPPPQKARLRQPPDVVNVESAQEAAEPPKLPKELAKFQKMEENVQRIQELQQNKLTIMLGLVVASTFLFDAIPYALVEIDPILEPFWLIGVSFNAMLNGTILLWRNKEIRQSARQLGVSLKLCRPTASDTFVASS